MVYINGALVGGWQLFYPIPAVVRMGYLGRGPNTGVSEPWFVGEIAQFQARGASRKPGNLRARAKILSFSLRLTAAALTGAPRCTAAAQYYGSMLSAPEIAGLYVGSTSSFPPAPRRAEMRK